MSPIPYDWPLVGGTSTETPTDADPVWTQTSALEPVDHFARAMDRLAQQYREKPYIRSLIKILARQCADLETAYQQLLLLRSLDTAVGEQLDVIGRIVRESRNGAPDDEYRLRIGARIRINASSGTIEDVIGILAPLVRPGTVSITEFQPAAMRVEIVGVGLNAAQAEYLPRFLRQGKDAGVKATLHYSRRPPGETFRFDTGPGFDVGHFANAKE